MPFLTKSDLNQSIRLYRLNQITDADDTIITSAIATAESMVINYLSGPGYDYQNILAQTGASRDQQLVDWMRNLTLYLIYKRIPDEQVPERVIKDYDDTKDLLLRASDGRLSLILPKISLSDGTKATRFRGGSEPRRRN